MTEINPRRELTIRAAWLYHERALNQQAVADRLGVSRSTVSRLLADAEREGIVRVTVTESLPESARLAEGLIERYGLEGATVELALEGETPRDAAGTAMARRLEHAVAAGSTTIAAGWGRTLGRAAQIARSMHTSGVTIIDAFGHTTTPDIAPAVEVTNNLGLRYGAKVMHIPSPGFAPNAAVAANFYDSESVSTTLERARAADMTMVAVGVVGPESLLITAGYMTHAQMDEIIEAGAVGEVFGIYFDAEGNTVEQDALHPISLTLDDLRASRRVIAAVGGTDKTEAVKGAIATGAIHELAIDDSLARALLE
ncbi:MAG: MarR family transcriptional regulator [bacterium]|nr:MarR family transcriptional regulator [bacterium]